MKLVVARKSFVEALSIAARFTTSKAQLPILGNVLLESKNSKLSISATNLEMSVSQSIASKIEKEGKITIPAKVIYDVVSNLNSENVDLSVDKEQLYIKSENFSSKILGINASDFPQVPSSVGASANEIDAEVISSALAKVIYSVSSDETRPTLTGVLMLFKDKKLSLVATDGYRLSKYVLSLKSSEKDLKIILPKGILAELGRLVKNEKLLFEYRKDDKQVVFQVGSLFLSSRIIEGDFPDYEKIIPASSKLRVGVDKDDLLQGIKLAGVFARTASNVVNFVVKEASLKLVAESSQSGSQENTADVKVECDEKDVFGEKGEFVIAFNCEFVENFLNSIDGNNLEIGFNDANSPGVFLDTEDKNLLHLIMPVRLQG
jgi:DNA polymerase-3 subunit beta